MAEKREDEKRYVSVDYSYLEGNYIRFDPIHEGEVVGIAEVVDWNGASRYKSNVAAAVESGIPLGAALNLSDLAAKGIIFNDGVLVRPGTIRNYHALRREGVWLRQFLPEAQMGWYTASDSSTGVDVVGLLAGGLTASDDTSSRAVDKDGVYLKQDTTAVAGGDAGLRGISAGFVERLANPRLLYKFKLSSVADIRFFAGFSTGSLATSVGSDNPGISMAGLQFSTDRGDSTWQYMVHDGTTQQLIESNLTPNTNAYYLVVTMRRDSGTAAGADVRFDLFDADFNELGAATTTVNIPLEGDNLVVCIGLETRAAAVKSIQQYYGWLRIGERGDRD